VFNFKTFPDPGQIRGQETGQILNFLSHKTIKQLFVPSTNCLKYKNIILSIKHCTRQQTLKVCAVLFGAYLLQIKQALSVVNCVS
jgi:hypothetical protein